MDKNQYIGPEVSKSSTLQETVSEGRDLTKVDFAEKPWLRYQRFWNNAAIYAGAALRGVVLLALPFIGQDFKYEPKTPVPYVLQDSSGRSVSCERLEDCLGHIQNENILKLK